ncbi:MAG: hypothetical protein Kow0098_05750 [Ignavibacteriaceae bacterium]
MPVCPNCKYEYIEGITICPDCNMPLVDEKELTEHELSEEDWVIIYQCAYEYEAEMIKDNLAAAGIGAAILSQKDRNFPAPGDLSVVKLLVKRDDLKPALEFIESLKRSGSKEDTEEE